MSLARHIDSPQYWLIPKKRWLPLDMTEKLLIWAKLFKINDIVTSGERFVKISNMNITNRSTQLFFVCKMCTAKDSHILSTKNNSVFAYLVSSYLTSRGLN